MRGLHPLLCRANAAHAEYSDRLLCTDDGSELELPLRAIAEQFLELYWRHSAPYGTGADSVLILHVSHRTPHPVNQAPTVSLIDSH